MQIEARLTALGIDLPAVAAPKAKYVPTVRTGNLVFVSGQLPTTDGVLVTGKAGSIRTTEQAKAAARACAVNILAALKAELGDLDRVVRIVKLQAFVNSAPHYTEQHLVTNGASELLGEVFGDAGLHARTAVGVAALPLDATVEIEAIVEVK